MNIHGKMAILALGILAMMGMSSLSASARIVCNVDGDCWHVHDDYAFPPGVGVVIHPDTWRWRDGERFAWREHDGLGYWHGGEWRGF
jgi:hypothetical protein